MSGKYRRGVGIILMNAERKVFVGQRYDQTAEAWQMPQGGIDDGESPEVAFYRELEEEVGVTRAQIDLVRASSHWLRYDLPDDLKGKLWGGHYVGQEQKWFLCLFKGRDKDIHLDRHQPPEFRTWKWASPAELLSLIVPFKIELYRQVLNEFSPELGL